MNDSKTKSGTGQAVVAMLKEDGQLKGVALQAKRKSLELVWAKTARDADADWTAFAAECGVPQAAEAGSPGENGRTLVVGFGSTGTVFHRASLPSVETKELASIVQFQAETRLPLPADQTELAWRVDPSHNGQMDVTMAVARKELLQTFAADVRCLAPARILLDCEAMVKAWATVFSGSEDKAILVSMGQENTQVCLVEHRRLSNAVILDSSLADFATEAEAQTDTAENTSDAVLLDSGLEGFSIKEENQAEVTERFAQDIRSVIDFFGHADDANLPVILLSDSSPVYDRIVSSLNQAQVRARVAVPDVQVITLPGESGMACLHEYRIPIGLGLLAIDDGQEALNLFQNLYQPAGKTQKTSRFLSPKVALGLASVMLLVLIGVSYVLDRKRPQAIRDRIAASIADTRTDLDALVERQTLIKTIARERPDMLALLSLVNSSGEDGILLNSLGFKKGQKVTITGQAQNNEQLYKFHEKLRKHKDLAEVQYPTTGKVGGSSGGSSGRSGSKGKGITFTFTFQYKNFSNKARANR